MTAKQVESEPDVVKALTLEAQAWLEKQLRRAAEAELDFTRKFGPEEAKRSSEPLRNLALRSYEHRLQEINLLVAQAHGLAAITDTAMRQSALDALEDSKQ